MFLNQLKSESKRKKSKNKALESIFERELSGSKKGKRKSSKRKSSKGKRKSSKRKRGSSKGKKGSYSRKLRGGRI